MASGSFSIPPRFTPIEVSPSLFAENRAKLIARVRAGEGFGAHPVLFMAGGKQEYQYDTDREILFRQESNFAYLFGVEEPDFHGLIEFKTGKAFLFMPRLPEEYAVWDGQILPPPFYKEKYCVDEVYYNEDVERVIGELGPDMLWSLKTSTHPIFDKHTTDKTRMEAEIAECRVIKSDKELEVLRYAATVSSRAHIEVMKQCRPGMKEYQLESIFLHDSYYHGKCRYTGYPCICATGKGGATLHYHANEREVKDGDMLLLDMGAEYRCYGADITCSFPASGKFTEDQKAIYETVLAAQNAVMAAMRPGVEWPAMHRLAEKVIAEGLLKHGFLNGTLEEILENHVAALFFPHGLGHFLGLNVHDPPYVQAHEKIQEPGIRYLRTTRVLQKNMLITVEPGLYFIDALLDPALKDPVMSKFLNAEKIARFRTFGGVRLEDDVIVTEDGIENITQCPRTIEEVEAIMAEGRKEYP